MHLRFLAKTLGLHNGLKALVASAAADDDDLLSSCSCINSSTFGYFSGTPNTHMRIQDCDSIANSNSSKFSKTIRRTIWQQKWNMCSECESNNEYILINSRQFLTVIRRRGRGGGGEERVGGPSVELCVSTACEEIKSQVINEFG